jgi:1,4-alpha-glucan branching enzyme
VLKEFDSEEKKSLSDLIIYKIHLGDFPNEFRGVRALLDAVIDKLGYLQPFGFNYILFMHWTAHRDKS